MPQPLLSVCLITYNHEAYIRQAIEGVLMQKVNFEWEFIIAEDCSTDGTRKIVEEYYAKYPELIKPILQEKNVGPGKNFIQLLSAAKGKYIAYFEGDDYWTDPDKLQKQVDFLEANPDFSICCHRSESLNENTGVISLLPKMGKSESTIEDLLRYNYILSLTIVVKNYTLKGFIPHFWNKMSDYGFHLSNAQFGKIKYLDDVMSVYRMHGAATWSDLSIEKRIASVINDYAEIDSDFNYKYHSVIMKAIRYRKNERSFLYIYYEKKYTIINLCRTLFYYLSKLQQKILSSK